jgi:hypothetical protein
MPAAKQIRVRCGFCRVQFPYHVQVRDAEDFRQLTAAGGLMECPSCHRFVILDKHTMSYGPEGGLPE